MVSPIDRYQKALTDLEEELSIDPEILAEELEEAQAMREAMEVSQDYRSVPIIKPDTNKLCRICKWSYEDIELYNWICERALEGMSDGKMYEALKTYVVEHEIDLKVPTRKSIYTHFSKHLKVKDLASIKAARKHYVPNIPERIVSDEGVEMIEQVAQGNFDEYEQLCNLYIKFRETHNKIYEMDSALKVSEANGASVWSQSRIQTYVSMVNTMRSVLSDIAKMRQSDRLIKLAAQHSLRVFTQGIISKLAEEFGVLGDLLNRAGIDSELLETFENVTHQRLAAIIMAEADFALDSTSKEFKLPN
jgi:hypothetical protein